MNQETISKEELDIILKFIEDNDKFFKTNITGSNRKGLPLEKSETFSPDDAGYHPPQLISDIKQRILRKENIKKEDWRSNHILGDFIGHVSNGGFVHHHKDPSMDGFDHVRFNLFLSVPKEGGYPIYDGVTIPVEVGDYVRCNSGLEYHESQVVVGDIPRITISYGILLKSEIARS